MATKKTEQSDAEELVHYQLPDGSWKEMTKAQADALEKEQQSEKQEEQIKTRSA